MTTHNTYVTELLLLKQEITQLKTTIAMAVEQITKAIASLKDNHHPSMPNAMETELENTSSANSNTTNTIPSHQLDLPTIINKLKTTLLQLAMRREPCSNNVCHSQTPPPLTFQ